MAITNYSELQTAIINWSHRSDLAAIVPDFISLSEAKFNRYIRTRQMETSDSLTPVSGIVTLPTDYLQLRRIYIDTDTPIELEYLPPEQFYVKFPILTNSSISPSRYYTIEGDSIHLSDEVTTNDVVILYYAKIPDLATNSTNWLLTACPDLYLYAGMAELSDYIKNANEVMKWNTKALEAVNSLIMSDKRGKFAGSAMRVIAA